MGFSRLCKSDVQPVILQVSKPGVYREFGSDDGLKAAALKAYKALAIDPFLSLLETKQPLAVSIEMLVSFLLQDRDALNIPKGCLFVNLRTQKSSLGPETLTVLDRLRRHFLDCFVDWIDGLKTTGELGSKIPSRITAHQFDALHAGAMRMQVENAATEEIDHFLRSGFATTVGLNMLCSMQV